MKVSTQLVHIKMVDLVVVEEIIILVFLHMVGLVVELCK